MYSTEERINDYLDRTGRTRTELAGELGMSRQTLRKKISGQIEFKLSEAAQLACILGCTVDDFRKPIDSGQVLAATGA